MMGKSGGYYGKLQISSSSATSRSFTLDLSNITDKTKYAFVGDLQIEDGVGNTSVLLGGKGISGGIRVMGGTNEIVFSENAEAGLIWIHKGISTITFEKNATIRAGNGSGIIYVGKSFVSGWGDGTGGQTFVFNGTNNIIENTSGGSAIDISADSDNSSLSNTYNRLTFNKGTNTIKGRVQSQIDTNNATDKSGKNTIVFGSETTSNTIQGEIYSWFGYNTIVFAGASNPSSTLDNLSTTATNKLIGNITSNGLNGDANSTRINNLVYFKEDGYIEGNVNAMTNSNGASGTIPYSRNMVVFEKKGYIKGNITGSGINAWYNKNYLVFKDDAKIEGSVGGATNSILLSGANKTLTITEAVQGNAKIWGTSTSPDPITTPLNYDSDEAYKTNVANFFNTQPDNATLTGTINLNGGVSAGGNDVRADTFNISKNADGYAIKNTGGTNTFYAKTTATITGKISASGSGFNNITAPDGTFIIEGISTKGNSGISGNTLNLGNSTLTINARSGETGDDSAINDNAIYAWNGDNNNIITAQTINVNGNMVAGGGISSSKSSNSLSGVTMSVTGNITGNANNTNNFTFTADNGTLTLKGGTNQITTLTAKSDATTGDTLIIDGTTNANNTTIDTLTNGDSLIVKFNGQGDSNGATLNLKDTNTTLKQVIVNDNSTNNTLDLTQTTQTTINTKIAIADAQQIAINLRDTELVLAKDDDNLGLTTTGTGISTINVSNTGTLSGGDIVATNLNMTGGTATTTFKNANTTFNTLTANATTNTLRLDAGSSAVTIGSTDSTFNATFAGNSAQTLAINGGENTITTLTLNAQSDTLSIGGGSTTITSAITSDTNNNLTLQIGSSDSSKSASLTLSGAITTDNTQSGTEGVANVVFTGSTTASSNLATLTLKGSSNTLTGVTTQTANALIEAGANTSNLGTLTFSGTSGTQSLQINGGTNTITSLALSNTAGVQNILTQNAGNTTITDAISVGANQNLTLALTSSSDRLNPSETSVTLSGAITKGSGVANVTFTGGIDNQHYYSDLILTQSGNTLSSVTSNAKNARITMKDTAGATIETTTIGSNSSLVFGFTGSGESTVTLSDGITVGSGSTLGISLGVSDATTQTISGNITLQDGSTLLVDFLDGNQGSATLGDGQAIVIGANRKSIINFHGENSGNLNGSGIEVKGGDNTINFLGSAEISSLTLTSGTNTINVYAPKSGDKDDAITATIVTSQVGSVSNTINLDDYAVLDLQETKGSSGSGTLASSGLANTLNFKGNEAIFKGGFEAISRTMGNATINVGSADKEIVSGTITGQVSNASLNFNAGTSILTLQSQTNTFTAINSQAKDGVLVLDTTSNQVDATISGATTIASGKSLSFDFQGNNASTITTTGGLVIDGTLGVIINGNGNKAITGNINLNGKGTLLVDYKGGTQGQSTLTLGSGSGITIGKGESSIINFNGGGGELKNTLTLAGGSNTINFNVEASLDKITLTSGNNTFNVADSITATIGDTSDVGGVHNTINLGANSTIDLQNGDSQSGSGSIITSLNNTLNFKGNGATLKGSFGASGNGSARVNVAGSNSVITGSLSNASITFSSDNADLTLQSGNSTITSLTGFTAPSTYTRNGRTITQTITNTLTLDGTTDVSATITSAVVGDSVGLKFGGGSEKKTFTFQANGNHLTGVAFGTTSTNNTLAFTNGNSTLENASVSSGNGLTIELGNANLALTSGYSGDGTKGLSVTGNASVSGGTISADALTFANNTSLSISNSGNNTFASVDANSNAGTLIANDSALTITALTGNNLTAGFSGNSASSIEIVDSSNTDKTITLAGIVLNNNAKGTLNLTALTNTTITNNVSVGANQSLAINLGGASVTDATLTFSDGLSGNATINADATTSNTIAGGSIALSNLNLSGTDNTTTLTASNVAINTLNANATSTNTLKLDATSGNVSASINSIGSTTRSVGDLDIALISTTSNATTLSLNGNTINSLDIQGDNNNLEGSARIGTLSTATASGGLVLDGGVVSVGEQIAPTNALALTLNNGAKLTAEKGLDSTSANINLTLNNSTLSLGGATSKITSLSGNGGVIDFVSSGKDTSKSLTISGDCNANANVITYVDTSSSGSKANLVTVEGTNSTGILTISAYGDADEIFSITYDANDTNGNNVQVASVGNNSIDVKGGTSDIDGEIIQITLTEGATGNWYIGSAISKGVDTSVQEVVTSALAVNYDLYLANFNSLNKRMGELRNTQESNGVWARVFGGAMSNDFGVGSKTDYITTQAGYDYSLSVGENARNFIGVAIAYGASSTKSNPSSNPNTGVLDNISSSMVEVGVYNSYVADSGWYNDTIFKFDYIMSDFTLKTGANSQQNSTNNFAMILSDEFGYRYSFGENEKGSWYIDPQAEFAFGYFNQSDFNQALNESATRTIKATQDSILTLRSRVGASLGKKFNTDKGFASLYVGAFYEYDYIEGGKSDYALISSQGEVSNPLQSLESNGRAILNVGSNIELTKGARLYIDVEKSFGDKQRTFMQFNLGARYSF